MADQDTEKLKQVRAVIKLAEKWSEDQVMPQSQIALSALKDIQRIVGDGEISLDGKRTLTPEEFQELLDRQIP